MFDADKDISSLKDKDGQSKRVTASIKETKEVGCTTQLAFVECDLTRLSSVKAAVDKILSEQTRLDLLMANSGGMNQLPGLIPCLLIKNFFAFMSQTAKLSESEVRIIPLTSTVSKDSSRYPDTISVIVTLGIVGTNLVSNGMHFIGSLSDFQRNSQSRTYSIKEALESHLWCPVGLRSETGQSAFYKLDGVLSKITTKYTKDESKLEKLVD
ncbi:oxidoreductase [Xylaria arbuscula]|nr:oxidoreductase [Xylaria arbuscula]